MSAVRLDSGRGSAATTDTGVPSTGDGLPAPWALGGRTSWRPATGTARLGNGAANRSTAQPVALPFGSASTSFVSFAVARGVSSAGHPSVLIMAATLVTLSVPWDDLPEE